MSSDYSPLPQGPPIIHRDEPATDKPAPDPEQDAEQEPEAQPAPDTDPHQENTHDDD